MGATFSIFDRRNLCLSLAIHENGSLPRERLQRKLALAAVIFSALLVSAYQHRSEKFALLSRIG
jgi:hypothetical protein